MEAPDAGEIAAAARRLEGRVHRTPVARSRTLDALAGLELHLKCENLQRAGAFKIRGATNAVQQLDGAVAARGVVTHSSGNHGQALALAARERGIPAHIVMPTSAPAVKRAATEGYGAHLHECAPTQADREATAQRVAAETGATPVPPFDHPHVIAGQGTVVAELLEQVAGLDAIVAPVGGGGLLAGSALALQAAGSPAVLVGAEPAGADDTARSFATGARQPMEDPRTLADGLRTGVGALTWPVIRSRAAGVATVDDAAIVAAMRLLWERCKLVVEPSGAVALAVALGPGLAGLAPGARRVGVVLSGGNVDLDGFFSTLRLQDA